MALINCSECGKEYSDKAPACPNCGCPTQPGGMTPVTAPQEKEAPKTTKGPKPAGCATGCGVLLLLLIGLASIGVLTESSDTPSTPTQSEDTSWVPKGFTRYNSKVAIKWSPSGSYSCSYGDSCTQLEVVPRVGCGRIYAELTKHDSAGNNVGYTNETTSNVQAGQKAILKFETYGDFKAFQLSKISCY